MRPRFIGATTKAASGSSQNKAKAAAPLPLEVTLLFVACRLARAIPERISRLRYLAIRTETTLVAGVTKRSVVTVSGSDVIVVREPSDETRRFDRSTSTHQLSDRR